MKTPVTMFTLASFLCMQSAVSAQAPAGFPGKAQEHEILKMFVGEWEVESEGNGITGKANMNCKMLGDLWIVNTSEHDFAGMNVKSIQMIGYDANRKKYIGTWADSMTSYLWHYQGTYDKDAKKLTLEAKGPSMTGDGTMINYRDAYEFKDENTIIATSSMEDSEGEWTVFMQGTAKRKQVK